MKREVRVRQRLIGQFGREQRFEPQPLVLVTSSAWVLVRHAEYPTAMPDVMSRKEWDALPVQPALI